MSPRAPLSLLTTPACGIMSCRLMTQASYSSNKSDKTIAPSLSISSPMINIFHLMARNKEPDHNQLIMHVGTHKTASTYIQHRLNRNKQFLRKQGILYPRKRRAERRLINSLAKGTMTPGTPCWIEQVTSDAERWSRLKSSRCCSTRQAGLGGIRTV